MISADLYRKTYDSRVYNCAHFLRDAWLEVTNEDLGEALSGFLAPRADRKTDRAMMRRFKPLAQPQSPCVVMMRHGVARPHVGMFYQGRVLQLRGDGVSWLPLQVATVGYPKVRFYA